MTWSLRKSLGKSLAGAVVVGSASLVLAGCVIFVPTGPGEISSDDAPGNPVASAQPGTECRGGEAVLSESDITYTMIARCDLVVITGNDVTVTVPDAGRIEISGDRTAVTTSSLDSLLITGNDNAITLDNVATLEISGYRETVTASGVIENAVVNGNENTVRSDVGIGSVADSGERNSFTP